MLSLVLALAVTQAPNASNSRVTRVERVPKNRVVGGRRGGFGYAFFEAFPVSGAGVPAECSTGTVTGAKGETLTFTRASSAYCTKQDGTLVLLSTNQPRIMSGAMNSSWRGILVEPTRGNAFTAPSDLSNAAWAKTSMTCTRNATGPDNAANSASTCTSSAINGTVTQASSAGTGITSVYVKAVTVTGAINFSTDNFGTVVNIGPSLSTSAWRRVVPIESPGCAGGGCIIASNAKHYSAGAPTVGLKFANSGDSVQVWTFQDENLSGSDVTAGIYAATSPINENIGVTRAVDRAQFAVAAFSPASMAMQMQYAGQQGAKISMSVSNGTDVLVFQETNGATADQRTNCARIVSTSVLAGGVFSMPFSGDTWLYRDCQSVSGGVLNHSIRGRPETATGATANVSNATKVQVGGYDISTGFEPGSVYRGICTDPVYGRCSYANQSTGGNNPIAWVGDSITMGNAGSAGTNNSRPPYVLEAALRVNGLVSAPGDRAVYNMGVGGYRTDQCLSTWRNYVRGKGFSTLILLCGVNSAIQGIPATSALAWADLQTILDEARADGMKVIPMTILPFGSNVNWNASRQTYITDINTSLLNYCTTNSLTTCLDEYTAFLGVSPAMNVAYDSGDGLHPNDTGSAKLATDANTKAP